MQDFKITIPKPCHEDWDKMSPNEKGKYCCVCEKTVVDFSVMEPVEIKSFFEAKKGEKICGHFKTEQVDKHIPEFHQWLLKVQSKIQNNVRVPVFGKLALGVVGFSMFLVGCAPRTKTMGEPAYTSASDSKVMDSTKCSNQNKLYTIGDTVLQEHKKGMIKYSEPKKDTSTSNQQFIDGEVKLKK